MPQRTCTAPGCVDTHYARGLCRIHYVRMKRHGSLDTPLRSKPVADRFWAKVDKTETCWVWTGAKRDGGYGVFKAERLVPAHRFSYQMATGSAVPADMEVDHICHNPSCVNPEHLRAVTPQQNQENKSGPPRNNRSGVRGVSWNSKGHCWVVNVKSNGKQIYGGRFSSVSEAEIAVLALRIQYHTHNDADRRRLAELQGEG